MKRVIVGFTDSHIKPVSVARLDDYASTVLGKLGFIFEYAKEAGAAAIVCSGDLGDNRRWSDSLILMASFAELRYKYRDIPLITTVGQHDVEGHNIAKYKDYVLGLLEESGLLEVVTKGDFIDLPNKIRVHGFGFGESETSDFLDGRIDVSSDASWLTLALVHAQVGDEQIGSWQEGIAAQNIQGSVVAAFGDIHKGFLPHEFPGGALAFSCGAVTRCKTSERYNTPRFWVLTEEDGIFDLQYVDIPHASDEEIFGPEREEHIVTNTAVGVKAAIARAKSMGVESASEKVRRVGTAAGYKAETINTVVSRLIT